MKLKLKLTLMIYVTEFIGTNILIWIALAYVWKELNSYSCSFKKLLTTSRLNPFLWQKRILKIVGLYFIFNFWKQNLKKGKAKKYLSELWFRHEKNLNYHIFFSIFIYLQWSEVVKVQFILSPILIIWEAFKVYLL